MCLCIAIYPGLHPASSIRPATSDGQPGHPHSAYQQLRARPQTASPSKKQLIRERVRQMEYAEAAKRLMVTQTGVMVIECADQVSGLTLWVNAWREHGEHCGNQFCSAYFYNISTRKCVAWHPTVTLAFQGKRPPPRECLYAMRHAFIRCLNAMPHNTPL